MHHQLEPFCQQSAKHQKCLLLRRTRNSCGHDIEFVGLQSSGTTDPCLRDRQSIWWKWTEKSIGSRLCVREPNEIVERDVDRRKPSVGFPIELTLVGARFVRLDGYHVEGGICWRLCRCDANRAAEKGQQTE